MKLKSNACWVSIAVSFFVHWLVPHSQGQSLAPPPVIARTDNSLTAVVASGAGKAISPGSCRGVTNRIGLEPGQVVTITLHFPANRVGDPLTVQPLDGGVVLGVNEHALSSAGILQFQFQANQAPGLTQVLVRLGADDFGLQFYVLDPKHPDWDPNNPDASPAESVTYNGFGQVIPPIIPMKTQQEIRAIVLRRFRLVK